MSVCVCVSMRLNGLVCGSEKGEVVLCCGVVRCKSERENQAMAVPS
jgi:hypothetical protein